MFVDYYSHDRVLGGRTTERGLCPQPRTAIVFRLGFFGGYAVITENGELATSGVTGRTGPDLPPQKGEGYAGTSWVMVGD